MKAQFKEEIIIIIEKNLKSKKPRVLLFNPPSLNTKNIVRDLLYGCWCQGKRIAGAEFPPHSLISLYTVLKKENIVKLLDYQKYRLTKESFAALIQKIDWLVIPVSFQSFHDDLSWMKIAKQENPSIKIIIFGSLSTFSPEVVSLNEIDFGIMGEPELSISELVQSNLTHKENGSVKENWEKKNINNNNYLDNLPAGTVFYDESTKNLIKTSQVFPNIDNIPIPDRKLILNEFYFNPLTETKNWTTMLTSRGCPNNCIFCTSPSFHGSIYRYNSPKRLIKEIEYLISLGYKEIFFRDETFTTNISRIYTFCKLIIQKKIDIKWICNSRVNHITPRLLKYMKAAGCHTIKFGVESGNQKILDILDKGISVKQIVNAFNLCKEFQIKTHAHMIVASPRESQKNIQKSIELLKMIEPTSVSFNLFTPFPGSPYYRTLENKKMGKFSENESVMDLFKKKSQEFYPELMNTFENINRKQVVARAYKSFYLRPKYFLFLLSTIKNKNDFNRILKSGLNVFQFMFKNEK